MNADAIKDLVRFYDARIVRRGGNSIYDLHNGLARHAYVDARSGRLVPVGFHMRQTHRGIWTICREPEASQVKPRQPSEEQFHCAVADYLNAVLEPPAFWTSIDHGAGKLAKRSAGMAKRRGVKAGLPDVWIFSPDDLAGCSVVCIELKTKTGELSEAQKATHKAMKKAGICCHVARSIEDIKMILTARGIPTRRHEI